MQTKQKTRPSALAELDRLRRAAHDADAEATTADAARRQSHRWLPAAQARLAEYLTAVESNTREPNPDTERQLRDKVTDSAAMRVKIDQRGNTVIYADRRKIAALEDAMGVAQDAAGDVARFIVEHRVNIENEMSARSIDARDRLLAAVDTLSGAVGQWQATARDWRELLARWPDLSPGEIPLSPLPGIAMQDIELVVAQVRGGAKDPRGALPMPVSLAPCDDPDDQATSPGSLRGWAKVPRVISREGGLRGA